MIIANSALHSNAFSKTSVFKNLRIPENEEKDLRPYQRFSYRTENGDLKMRFCCQVMDGRFRCPDAHTWCPKTLRKSGVHMIMTSPVLETSVFAVQKTFKLWKQSTGHKSRQCSEFCVTKCSRTPVEKCRIVSPT